MSSARGKRSQPRWRCALGAGAPGRARTAASKGTAGRSGGSGPAGPRSRRGRWARTQRRARRGRKPRTRQRSRVAAGDGQRGPDDRLGRPGDLDGEGRAPEGLEVGRRHLPAVGEAVDELRPAQVDRMGPRRRPRAPGWPPPSSPCSRSGPARARRARWRRSRCAPCLTMCTDVAATVAAGPGWVAGSCGVPDAVGKALAPAPPPAAESRASWSMFHPVHVVGVLAHGGL